MKEILTFDNSIERYLSLGEQCVDEEKYEDALRYFFCALKMENSPKILRSIALTYSDMGLYEFSNKYWIKFLNANPKEGIGDAYEELGINFFYLDNFILSSYYLNKKVSVDGVLSRDDLNEEILEYFTDSFDKKKAYKVAYPFDKADYTDELKKGKIQIANCDFKGAVETLTHVPFEAKEYYEAQDEMSLAEFLSGNVDGAIEINKRIIEGRGENVSSLCNLSSMYNLKGDDDKSDYYYKKALSIEKDKEEDNYKLATCSLERKEHKKAIYYIDEIIKDKPFEVNLKYLLALALLNNREYERAKKILFELVSIVPDNPVYNYYLKLSDRLLSNVDAKKIFPLAYEDDYPKQDRVNVKKRIAKYLTLSLSAMKKIIDTAEFLNDVLWAFYHGDEESAKTMSFILVSLHDKRSDRILFDILCDSEISDSYKGALLFTLIMNGFNGIVGVACGNFYNRIKIRKVVFENNEKFSDLFVAYSLLMTKLSFVEIDNYDKVAFNANKVYRRFKEGCELEAFKKEDMAGLILYLCDYKRFKSINGIAKLVKSKKESLEKLISVYGEKNDKDN